MCYSDDAHPPYPPVSGGSSSGRDFRLTSADGTSFLAYASRAGNPTGAGIVVLPDVRGLHHFYKELADRFAEAGYDSVAFDYFGRTAETDDRGEDFVYRPHVDATTQPNIAADTAAAIAYLKSPGGGAVSHVFTVGFCFGGSTSWRQAAAQPDLTGAIGFYGQPARTRDIIDQIHAPLLLLIAGEDFVPVEEFHKFDKELTDAGIDHKMVIYEGAPHSFFDRKATDYAEASADAWNQMIAFIGEHS
jgi:carboxymethylenebutenolidase